MKQMLLALQFLTILPVRVKGMVSEKELAQSATFFPLVGAFQGLLAALSSMILLKIFSSEIVAGLIILIFILSNGGFHLDGLSDTFDALATKSTGDKEADISRRLAIMKDSTTGAIGVMAIVIVILLKFLFIKDLLTTKMVVLPISILFLMPVFSKWTMLLAMYHGTPARQDGLGRIFIENVKANTLIFSSIIVLGLCTGVAKLYLLQVFPRTGIVALFMMVFASLYGFSLIAVWFCRKRFNGLTGDTLGALSEISEIIFLMVIAIWWRGNS